MQEAANHHCHPWSCFECGECVPKNGRRNTWKQKCSHIKISMMSVAIIFQGARSKKMFVQNVSPDPVSRWYCWDRSFSKRYIKEICVRRYQYDVMNRIYVMLSCIKKSLSKDLQ
jgi:hypothetical protein